MVVVVCFIWLYRLFIWLSLFALYGCSRLLYMVVVCYFINNKQIIIYLPGIKCNVISPR